MTETAKLPTQKSKASQINPKRLIIYSKYKTGKTSISAQLENNLILDLEKGSKYVEALKIEANTLDELKQIGKQIREANYPYKYLTVDTVTALEDMVGGLALQLYKATSMGKNYADTNVLKLANGAGYMYLREAFFQVLDYIDTLAPNIILLGHIKEKQIDDNGKLVEAANIALTGKIKSLICSQADAIGYMYRKDNTTMVTFKSNDEVTCGARPEHLRNQEILLAEEIDGKLVTYWDKIYK
jgi:hypothetical protein